MRDVVVEPETHTEYVLGRVAALTVLADEYAGASLSLRGERDELVLALVEVGEVPVGVIAERLGTSEGMVRKILWRTRRRNPIIESVGEA